MTQRSDPLARFRGTGNSVADATVPAAQKQPYIPFQLSEHERRHLEIRLKYPEPAECPSNLLLSNVRIEWRYGLGPTLQYGKSMVIIIKGENLTEMSRAIKDWKVEWIAEFDPDCHILPSDKSAPFIESITIHTSRPEEPPPADKRH